MGWDAPWHWALVALAAIALFGYKKLPDASRSLGRSLRIFKTELKGMAQDDEARESAAKDVAPAQQLSVNVTKPAPAQQPQAPTGGEPSATQG